MVLYYVLGYYFIQKSKFKFIKKIYRNNNPCISEPTNYYIFTESIEEAKKFKIKEAAMLYKIREKIPNLKVIEISTSENGNEYRYNVL